MWKFYFIATALSGHKKQILRALNSCVPAQRHHVYPPKKSLGVVKLRHESWRQLGTQQITSDLGTGVLTQVTPTTARTYKRKIHEDATLEAHDASHIIESLLNYTKFIHHTTRHPAHSKYWLRMQSFTTYKLSKSRFCGRGHRDFRCFCVVMADCAFEPALFSLTSWEFHAKTERMTLDTEVLYFWKFFPSACEDSYRCGMLTERLTIVKTIFRRNLRKDLAGYETCEAAIRAHMNWRINDEGELSPLQIPLEILPQERLVEIGVELHH